MKNWNADYMLQHGDCWEQSVTAAPAIVVCRNIKQQVYNAK